MTAPRDTAAMATDAPTSHMVFTEARSLNIADASVADLDRAWRSYASQISFHHADDTGKEWGMATAMMRHAREIERALHDRGAPRPTGDYLLSEGDRIDWETGDWSLGWAWKKPAQVSA